MGMYHAGREAAAWPGNRKAGGERYSRARSIPIRTAASMGAGTACQVEVVLVSAAWGRTGCGAAVAASTAACRSSVPALAAAPICVSAFTWAPAGATCAANPASRAIKARKIRFIAMAYRDCPAHRPVEPYRQSGELIFAVDAAVLITNQGWHGERHTA